MRFNLQKILSPSSKTCWMLFSIASIFFFNVYASSYSTILPGSNHDDAMLFNMAKSIASGNWLGEFSNKTLVKGPGLAIFEAFVIFTGIPYLMLIALYHISAVAYLMHKSEYIFEKYRIFWFIMGLTLLFNIFFISDGRVYRGQLMSIAVTVFIATIIALFNKNSVKHKWYFYLPEFIYVFISYGFLWYTREENLIYKVVLIFAILFYFILIKRINKVNLNVFPIVSGIIGVFACFIIISSLNYKHYERFIIFEKTTPPFSTVFELINSIHDPEPKYNVMSTEKIKYIAQNVPLFNDIAACLVGMTGRWSKWSYLLNEKTLQWETPAPPDAIGSSHFEWVWLDCAADIGAYKNAETSRVFHAELAKQLKTAIDNGDLKTKDHTFNMSVYSLDFAKSYLILRQIPNAFKVFFLDIAKNPSGYADSVISVSTNDVAALDWMSKLKVNIMLNSDKDAHERAKKSFPYLFCKLISYLFLLFGTAVIILAIPLSIIASVLTIRNKQFNYLYIILLLTILYGLHFSILTVLGAIILPAITVFYFYSSYTAILVIGYISLYIIYCGVNDYMSQKKCANNKQ